MSVASTPKQADLGVLAAAIEGTKGTAETFTAAHGGIECERPVIGFDLPVASRRAYRPYHDHHKSVPAGPRMYTLACSVVNKGASDAGGLPEFSELLRACGMNEAVSAGTSVTYTMVAATESQKTATVGLYMDGIRYQMAGAMADATFRFEQGEIPMIDFDIQGKYLAPTGTAILANTELNDVTPPEVDSATLTFQSTTIYATAVEVALGNVIAPRRTITADGGIEHFIKTGVDIQITVDPEVEAVGTRDFINKIVTAEAGEFVISIGTTAGNTITITCPQVQVIEAGPGDRDGIATYQITLGARVNDPVNGNDSISIVYS